MPVRALEDEERTLLSNKIEDLQQKVVTAEETIASLETQARQDQNSFAHKHEAAEKRIAELEKMVET